MLLPKEFEDRMKELLGKHYNAFSAAMDTPAVRALRVNTLKCSTDHFEEICDFQCKKLSFCDEGYIFTHDHIGSHPLHHAGAIYVQEPAAMAVIECLHIEPGMKILDACASPGGKSTQVAAKLRGNGVIVSNEIDSGRCQVLAQNIERMGVRNAVITNTDSRELGETYQDFFDLVIVDAPCSGEGMMRKNPLAVSKWSMQNIELCAKRQKEILENLAGCITGGGYLIYSSCTFAPEENELQIADFLSAHPDFHLIPMNERVNEVTADGICEYKGRFLGEEMKLCRRFYPHVSLGEGQFMALLRRDENTYGAPTKKANEKKSKKDKSDSKAPKLTENEEKIISSFLSGTLNPEGLMLVSQSKTLIGADGMVYISPDIPMPKGAGSLKQPGVPIGIIQKGRIIPHHNFFTAYGSLFRRQILLEGGDKRIEKYLHGESISTDCENGFAAVFAFGSALGGSKVTGGEAKNYYPRGLRI